MQLRRRICPASGPGCLTQSEIRRKAKEIIQTSGADTVAHFEKCEAVTNGDSFMQQAAQWLEHRTSEKSRVQIKPATAAGYECYIRRWLNPYLGHKPLASVGNKELKELVARLREANLSDKSIVEIFNVARLIVASAIDEETGKKRFPVEWNLDFINLPVIRPDEQNRPTIDAEQLTNVIASANTHRYRALYSLLPGTGLRIGEALAIHIGDCGEKHTWISSDCKTITVRKSIWYGDEQEPKTPSAKRSVDLCDDLAAHLREYIGNRKNGLLFQTDSGLPLSQSNIIRDSLSGLGVHGFHTFRRFRISHLEEMDCPEDLKKFWAGHAARGITELYGKQTTKNLRRRKELAERIGLGFKLDWHQNCSFASQCIPRPVENAA